MPEIVRSKNVATRIVFPLISKANRPAYYTATTWAGMTNETIVAYSWQDGQAAASLSISGTPAQLGTTGLWELALTAGEMNPDSGADNYVVIKFKADEIDEQTVLIRLKPIPVDIRQIGGNDIGAGSSAVLEIKQLKMSNNTGDAFIAESTGSNGNGMNVKGNGSGDGIVSEGGATGHGQHNKGGATSGHGVLNEAQFNGNGMRNYAIGNSNAGQHNQANGTTADGLKCQAGASGNGIYGIAPTIGHGIFGDGGSTSGSGIRARAIGTGDGLTCEKGSIGKDINADELDTLLTRIPSILSIASGAVESNLKKINDQSVVGNVATLTLKELHIQNGAGNAISAISSGGGGCGAYMKGNGSGEGARMEGGATASGMFAASGATSGSGVQFVAGSPNGNGIEAVGAGTGKDIDANELANMPTAVWAAGTRTLTSFGSLVSDIATAVWNSLTSGMTTVGSIGKKFADWVLGTDNKTLISTDAQDLSTTLDVRTKINNDKTGYALTGGEEDAIVDKVWDEATSGHTGAGTTGKALIDASTGTGAPTVGQIADAVCDEALSGHTGVGTVGEALNRLDEIDVGVNNIEAKLPTGTISDFDSSSDQVTVVTNNDKTGYSLDSGDISDIADAVCDEGLAGHTGVGTVGEALNRIDDIESDIGVVGSAVLGVQSTLDNGTYGLEEIKDAVDDAIGHLTSGVYGLSEIMTLLGTVDGNVDSIVAKLPAGTISDLALTTLIDGKTLSYILELTMAYVNGRFKINVPATGQVTFYKRDNATVLTIVETTTVERTRVS